MWCLIAIFNQILIFCENGGDKADCFHASFTHLKGKSAREFQTVIRMRQPQEFPDAHIWITMKRLCLLGNPLPS